jgi:hypothetical protein
MMAAGERPSLYVHLPPPPEVAKAIHLGAGTSNSAVEAASSPSSAEYVLAGRATPGGIELAWVIPNLDGKAIRDGLAMPLRTDWVAAMAKDAAARLEDYTARLARVRGWLELQAPDAGAFPYHLAVRNVKTHEDKTRGEVADEESYQLVLKADPERDRSAVERRRVYAFVLDSAGTMQLVFPLEGMENRFPVEAGAGPAEIPLGAPFKISPPFGNDTYFLLTSDEAIGDPSVLSSDGVRTRGASRGGDPLSSLLRNVGARTRGVSPAVPARWSVERLTLRSRARK